MYLNDSKQHIWEKKGLIQTFFQEIRSIIQFYCNLRLGIMKEIVNKIQGGYHADIYFIKELIHSGVSKYFPVCNFFINLFRF